MDQLSLITLTTHTDMTYLQYKSWLHSVRPSMYSSGNCAYTLAQQLLKDQMLQLHRNHQKYVVRIQTINEQSRDEREHRHLRSERQRPIRNIQRDEEAIAVSIEDRQIQNAPDRYTVDHWYPVRNHWSVHIRTTLLGFAVCRCRQVQVCVRVCGCGCVSVCVLHLFYTTPVTYYAAVSLSLRFNIITFQRILVQAITYFVIYSQIV